METLMWISVIGIFFLIFMVIPCAIVEYIERKHPKVMDKLDRVVAKVLGLPEYEER